MSAPIASVEIFSQGEEVVTGQIADTNAAWLAQELVTMGFDVSRHTAVGDRLDALRDLLREIAGRADCCLCTGGLGPTRDDLTAEAVGQAFGLKLALDEVALEHITAYFARLGVAMPTINRKQALIPCGAARLDNHWGTAPGFALEAGRCWFVFLPGVPSEMRGMFQHSVAADLQKRFRLRPRRLITLRTVGIGESALQERLDGIALPPEVNLGFRAAAPEVQVKLLFPADFDETSLDATVQMATKALGEVVFSVEGLNQPGGDLPQTVGHLLRQRQRTLAILESASGGLLASQCAGEPWFLEAAVFADTARLCRHFGLQYRATEDTGPLARTVAELAEKHLQGTGADYALAQLFVPAVARSEVFLALATPSGTLTCHRTVRGELRRRQAVAAAISLDLLRRHLRDLPMP